MAPKRPKPADDQGDEQFAARKSARIAGLSKTGPTAASFEAMVRSNSDDPHGPLDSENDEQSDPAAHLPRGKSAREAARAKTGSTAVSSKTMSRSDNDGSHGPLDSENRESSSHKLSNQAL